MHKPEISGLLWMVTRKNVHKVFHRPLRHEFVTFFVMGVASGSRISLQIHAMPTLMPLFFG